MGYFRPKVVYPVAGTDRKDSIIRYIGNRVKYQNKNFLCAVVGCLSGDTKVYGQQKTLEELHKSGINYIDTYSLKQFKTKRGSYYPVKSKSFIVPSGKKVVYEIELINGKKVLATEEHKFFRQKEGNKIEEVQVKDLKEGDHLRDYPEDYLKNYFLNSLIRSKEKTKSKYNGWKTCSKCSNEFYIEMYSGCKSRKYCNNCIQELTSHYKNKKNNSKAWLSWEDNLLRNLYYDKEKDFILNLMPHRTWISIVHRAMRLGIKRKETFQYEQNIFTTEDNPMNDIEIRKKASCSQQGIELKEWDGFKSYEPYTSEFNETFKESIRARDNYKCIECGLTQEEHKIKLHVHHIDYIKENTFKENCCTLCWKCHIKTNIQRSKWEQYLKNKLSNLYGYKYEEEIPNVCN